MGGANCEGEMGLETLRVFPWVDCVVSGETDAIFVDLCRALLDCGRGAKSGVMPVGAIIQADLRSKFETQSCNLPRPVIRDLDALPTPDYDDYFTTLRSSTPVQFDRTRAASRELPRLLVG